MHIWLENNPYDQYFDQQKPPEQQSTTQLSEGKITQIRERFSSQFPPIQQQRKQKRNYLHKELQALQLLSEVLYIVQNSY